MKKYTVKQFKTDLFFFRLRIATRKDLACHQVENCWIKLVLLHIKKNCAKTKKLRLRKYEKSKCGISTWPPFPQDRSILHNFGYRIAEIFAFFLTQHFPRQQCDGVRAVWDSAESGWACSGQRWVKLRAVWDSAEPGWACSRQRWVKRIAAGRCENINLI